MFSEYFQNKQPFVTTFFRAALESASSKLSHAYMLAGSDTMSQYYLSLQVAKALNCEKDRSENCTCTSCSWIKQNRHPAVITISPIDYTYGNRDSKTTTVITVDQARYLKEALSKSSQYYRVIIFTDALEGKEYENKADSLWKNYNEVLTPPPATNKVDEERLNWIPQPITYKIFQAETANALLKTIEEPGNNVLFFFLTRDKEDVIDTIVSRCQVIPFMSDEARKPDFSIIKGIIDNFPPQNPNQALYFAEKLMETAKEHSINLDELLDILQGYLHSLIKTNSDNKQAVLKLIDYIEKIEQAKLKIQSYVNAQAVIDSLFLSFA